MRVVTACVLAGALLVLTPVGAAQAPPTAAPQKPPPREPSTREALEQYLKGDYEVAVSNPPRLSRFNFNDADRWIASGGAAVERRRVAAALFALEYAGIRQGVLPAMLNWARGVLSRMPPRQTEALWLRASIALAEGLNRWVFLVEGVRQPMSGKQEPIQIGHIRFARMRFPDDPYFQMAEAIGAEMVATRPLEGIAGAPPESTTAWDRIASERLDAGGRRLAERTAALERAAGIFERLTTHETLGAEATLRLGYVRLRQGQSDEALAHLDKVPQLTKNVSLRYLAHLYAGWLLGHLGRTEEAATAYRTALNVVPRAQSATSLLVGLLVRNYRLAEAEAAAEGFLVADVAPMDPWRTSMVGDFPQYPQLIRQLRETLK